MAETLCNNTKTKVSLEGRTFESPCGFFGCSYKDFIDWFSTFKTRLNIAKNTYKRLDDISKLQDNPSLTETEQAIGKKIESLQLLINDYKGTKDDLTSGQYKALIEDLKVHISDITCEIETIQEGIESRGGSYTPSGLADSRASVFASPWVKWGAVALVGYAAFRYIDFKAS